MQRSSSNLFLLRAALGIAASIAMPSLALAFTDVEHRTLDQLYQAALREGGVVTVYAGGDTPGQQDGIKQAFESRFPGMKLNVIVDYSKFHDARIDNQLTTSTLVPDVAQLQTLEDFPRWRDQGVLLNYKPLGFESVYDKFKDPDGAFTGVFVDAFTNVVNQKLLSPADWPREASDYLKPSLKGKIVTTYPNDDDAVLFWYKQIVDKYGWSWVTQFGAQNPIFVRGTQAPYDYVNAGTTPDGKSQVLATFSTDSSLVIDPNTPARLVLPNVDPFMSWAQQAAIFKGARHPEAARLYLSWLLDKKTQANVWYMWSVRTDVPAPAGYRQIWYYTNTDPLAFSRFMADRAGVERFRQQMTLYLGEVKGDPSPGWLGLHPTQALPH